MSYQLPPPGIVRFRTIETGGWALCASGSIIVATHESMLDLARAVIAEEGRQAIAEDDQRRAFFGKPQYETAGYYERIDVPSCSPLAALVAEGQAMGDYDASREATP